MDKSNDSKEALISVQDTGKGINKKDYTKIFEKFEQLEDPSKRQYGGSGLGLAISKAIVEKHGGKIWVESIPKEGSCFYFYPSFKYNNSIKKKHKAEMKICPNISI